MDEILVGVTWDAVKTMMGELAGAAIVTSIILFILALRFLPRFLRFLTGLGRGR